VRIASLCAGLALVAVLAACEGSTAPSEAPAKQTFHPPAGDLLGLIWKGDSAELAELDPRTLDPGLRRFPVEQGAATLIAFSADGKTLALGHGEKQQVELVNVAAVRPLGVVELGIPGYISRLYWARAGMLFAAVGQQFIVMIDPAGRKVSETRQIEGTLLAAEPIEAGLVGLVAPADRIGLLKLMVWGGKGTSTVPLRMVGGWETDQGDDESEFRSRELVPGLAVDPTGRRALVVPPGGTVAEVDLRDLTVTYHTLSEPVSLFHRFLDWLDPAAEAKMIEGKDRQALWLASGLVAVSGTDYPPIRAGQTDLVGKPAGLSLIDTDDWSVRRVDGQVSGVQLLGSRLFAYEAGCSSAPESFALVAYDLSGKQQFRLCRDEGFDPQVVGDYLYVGMDNNTRFDVVDMSTGAIVSRLKTKQSTTLLVD
jgi:hypothetical protein